MALGERALAVVRGLPDHSVIDRLVRGRAWIPVLGVLLAGIVAMQVEILKVGSSLGRAMERGAALQTRNDSLQASAAGLADDQRIERLAAGMGMSMPSADSLVFLSAHPGGSIGRALGNIHAPDPTGFISQLAAQAAAAAALMPAPPATTSSTTATTTATVPGAATSGSATIASPALTPAAPTTGPGTTTGTASAGTGQGVTPAAPSTGAAGGTGSTTGVGSTAGGAAATGAVGVAPAGTSQSGGATGG